jgi:hypothetical protein
VAEFSAFGNIVIMKASVLTNLGLVFTANLVWIAALMYAASKFDPLNEYVSFLLFWIVPLAIYMVFLLRSGFLPGLHRALRLSAFGLIGFGLSLVSVIIVGSLYSAVLSHALNTQ